MKKQGVLPIDVEQALTTIGQRLESGENVEADLPLVVAGIAALPAENVSQASREIALTAKLYRWRQEPTILHGLPRRHLSDKEQLLRLPNLSFLFLFHSDGRIREAALQRISGGLQSPFLFAAVALRLNDWVEEVRSAAWACAQRCYPLTSPDVIAGAATALLLRQGSWGRWGGEREAIETAFSRPDVAARLADDLVNARTGPASKVLRAALKHDTLDPHLERLAAQAKQPSVRAMAVQTIADMRASWPAGLEWRWIDKSMGKRVPVQKFDWREITILLPRERTVRAAIVDRSALVRKASLDALIRRNLQSAETRELAVRLATDPARSVRERAAFILSRNNEPSSLTGSR
ncbi:hypothetical protein [Mesorhizobium sp. IMUNJ 23232]|uniref:hypothetical protein n=1 Tax=Mesorhizobium sp. IMUNJ 23232 TaxID=3376064 RepID=UPI0037ABF357